MHGLTNISQAGLDAITAWYDEALAHLSVECNPCYVETYYGRTHMLVTGNPDGPPVLLLHGLNNNALLWRPQLAALTDFRVYAIDIIGQPGRSSMTFPSLAGEEYADWLKEVMDALNLESAAMVGLSFGAYLTLKLGAHAPERVQRAVLVSPAGLARLKTSMLFRIAATNLPFRSHTEGMREILRSIFITPGVPMNTDTHDAERLLEIVHTHQNPIRDARRAMETLLPGLPIPAAELAQFTSPVLLMVGDKDVLFDAKAVVKQARRSLTGLVAAEIVPNAGHAMTYEYPNLVNQLIVNFLRAD